MAEQDVVILKQTVWTTFRNDTGMYIDELCLLLLN